MIIKKRRISIILVTSMKVMLRIFNFLKRNMMKKIREISKNIKVSIDMLLKIVDISISYRMRNVKPLQYKVCA